MSMWEGERKGGSPEWGLRGHAMERSDTYLYMKRHAFHQEAAGRSRTIFLVLQVLYHRCFTFGLHCGVWVIDYMSRQGYKVSVSWLTTHLQEGGYDALNLACGGFRSRCDSRRRAWSGHYARISPGERCENRHVETQCGEVQVQSRSGTQK